MYTLVYTNSFFGVFYGFIHFFWSFAQSYPQLYTIVYTNNGKILVDLHNCCLQLVFSKRLFLVKY
ncbi:MAG: hypothetical protein A3F93_01780 [Candidatus Magasanikbacteria bacterium RIFCSPLOWO2_12_FULL_34_7]|nr:MAG: hypothetical protein A3F93_01780 [Candidatus Magasanikbacteria bacterium RIFCSPLOWO2_12_FULL_34_7]